MDNTERGSRYGGIITPVLRRVVLALVAMIAIGAFSPRVLAQQCMQQKLLAGDAQAGDEFGVRVAVDGDTAIVGAYLEDTGGSSAGAAYVYTRSGGTWTQQQKLQAATPHPDDQFGRSVSISGDTVIVGAQGDSNGGSNSGAVYVYTRTGGVWMQQQKLKASDAQASDFFGVSVALSGDTAVVGARGEDSQAAGAGAGYVFTRTAGVWTQQQKLVASDGELNDLFGISAAVFGDTAVFGANGEDAGGANAGAVYVFTRTAGVWTQQRKLRASDGNADAHFGISASVYADSLVVGADGGNVGGSATGAAYFYTRAAGVWTEQQKLTAGDGQLGDAFGAAVSLSGDTAVIGAFLQDAGSSDAGAGYVFAHSSGVWTQQQKLTAFDTQAGDQFGYSAALSGDTVILGARLEDAGGSNAGAVYISSFACSDGNACTSNDTCINGVCVAEPPATCDDHDPCTDDVCDPVTGCTHTADDTNVCSDGNDCTNDHCSNGSCVGTAIDCDDHDPCTDDVCNPQGQCVHTPNGCGSTGACCTLPGCQVTTENMCVAMGGNYAGDGATCLAAACPFSQNDFKIGITAWGHTSTSEGIVTSPFLPTDPTRYSSVYGILEEDGFDLIRLYSPVLETKQEFKDLLLLIGNHGLKVMTSFGDFSYKIDYQHSESGMNIWDLGDADSWDGYYLNYERAFQDVYNVAPYKDIVWAHTMIAEYNPQSPFPFNWTPGNGGRPPRWSYPPPIRSTTAAHKFLLMPLKSNL